jgi:Ribophorin I
MIRTLAIVALLASAAMTQTPGGTSLSSHGVMITEYSSKVFYTIQNPMEKISITISNKSPDAIKSFVILLPADRKVLGRDVEDSYGQKLEFELLEQTASVAVNGLNKQEFRQYQVTPQQPISPEYDLKATITLYYNSFYTFKPKSVNLFDEQKVLVTVYKVPASPYPIKSALADINYGDSSRTERFSANDIAPLSPVTGNMHFPLNMHFVHSKRTSRYIEISHWGNIYFQEQYLLHNRAAKFKGEFSTLDFNKGRKDTGRHAFRSQVVKLPATAWGLFYRDEIGNITTSTVSRRVSYLLSRLMVFMSTLSLDGHSSVTGTALGI